RSDSAVRHAQERVRPGTEGRLRQTLAADRPLVRPHGRAELAADAVGFEPGLPQGAGVVLVQPEALALAFAAGTAQAGSRTFGHPLEGVARGTDVSGGQQQSRARLVRNADPVRDVVAALGFATAILPALDRGAALADALESVHRARFGERELALEQRAARRVVVAVHPAAVAAAASTALDTGREPGFAVAVVLGVAAAGRDVAMRELAIGWTELARIIHQDHLVHGLGVQDHALFVDAAA